MVSGMHQHLQVQSPSSSTILYTVSSLSSPRSRIVTASRHVIRIVVSIYAVLASLAKAQQHELLPDFDHHVTYLLDHCLIGDFIAKIVERLDWWLVAISSTAILYVCLKRDYAEESLLILQSLGIQTSSSSTYFFMNPSTTFIPTTQIQDIVIHEAFKGFEVRFFLAVIVDGAAEVVVVFPRLLPKREILEEVWRGSRKCLYGSAT